MTEDNLISEDSEMFAKNSFLLVFANLLRVNSKFSLIKNNYKRLKAVQVHLNLFITLSLGSKPISVLAIQSML